MKYHPISEVWPMMDEPELKRLAEDIKQNGLVNPVWIYEGKILDGRNRFKACAMVGVEVATREYKGDNPVQFAWSQNEVRRHMTNGQRAAMAAEIKPQLEVEAAKRRLATQGRPKSGAHKLPENVREDKHDRESANQAARITGTNERYVNAAERIKKDAPDLFDKLKAGKISLQDAKRESSRRPTTEEWSESELKRKAAVSDGESVIANYEKDKNLIAWAESKGIALAIDRSSKFGNPFLLGSDGTRDAVCDNFEKHYLPFKPSILNAARELKGKVLCCHCYPERCHGESYVRLTRRTRE